MPRDIWQSPWEPELPRDTVGGQQYSELSGFAEAVYAAASRHPEAHGTSMDAMVDALREYLIDAAHLGDYTALLSPDRVFRRLSPAGAVVSFGAGVEREVLWTALQKYQGDPRFCRPGLDGTWTIANSPITHFAAEENRLARKKELTIFGALTAIRKTLFP
ncbi:uncharacterized protein B0H18DRAFT_1123733 [Fomitopsis serialis]|nr:uncharacterized protein B0H18DRAFT_1123733 [Neoantrodia serialis]KAH9917283.1 hypothetical protein B0H18DRAFT_1123733 [Neoantrodia serialis]